MRKINKYLHCLLIAILNCARLDVTDPVYVDATKKLVAISPERSQELITCIYDVFMPKIDPFYEELTEPLAGFEQKTREFLEILYDYLAKELENNPNLRAEDALVHAFEEKRIAAVTQRFVSRPSSTIGLRIMTLNISEADMKLMQQLSKQLGAHKITKQDFIVQTLNIFCNSDYKAAIPGTVLSTLHKFMAAWPKRIMIVINACMPDFVDQFRAAEDKHKFIKYLLTEFGQITLRISVFSKALDHIGNTLGIREEDKDTFVRFVQEKRMLVHRINQGIMDEFNEYRADPGNIIVMSDNMKKLLAAMKFFVILLDMHESTRGGYYLGIMREIVKNETTLAAFVCFCEMHKKEMAPVFEKLNNLLATIE